MDGIAYLISNTLVEKDERGQRIKKGEVKTEIFVSERSITRNEFFSAGNKGLKPDICLETQAVNYSGEKTVEYNGKEYSVYRTYLANDSDIIELYLERRVSNGEREA